MSACRAAIYEPGTPHEHRCLSSQTHTGTDHTCECGHTWPNPVPSTAAQTTRFLIILGTIVAVILIGAVVANNIRQDARNREVSCMLYGGRDC